MRKLGFDLILLGAPVSGKDTQAEMLMNHYELKPVRSGVYFRKNINRKDAIGKKIRETVGKAKPAPVSLVKEFIKNEFRKLPKINFIFVGTPRLKPEAQFLVKLLKKNNRDFLVLYLQLAPKEIIKRSYHRMRHEDVQRRLIEKRISWHKTQVGKTVEYFKKMKKLKYINGNQPPLKVVRDIQQAINDYQGS